MIDEKSKYRGEPLETTEQQQTIPKKPEYSEADLKNIAGEAGSIVSDEKTNIFRIAKQGIKKAAEGFDQQKASSIFIQGGFAKRIKSAKDEITWLTDDTKAEIALASSEKQTATTEGLDQELVAPEVIKEQEGDIKISTLSPDNRAGVAAYYQFEIDNHFSDPLSEKQFNGKVAFRQTQIKNNQLQVALAKEGDQLIATTIVVLENGTMGKNIKPDEAWAAGTVVLPEKRGKGIGEQMSLEQDRLAKEAGKKFILTNIADNNYPSMRLRMKVGYHLVGTEQKENEVVYNYRKNLTEVSQKTADWIEKVRQGRLKNFSGKLDELSPNQILIDPTNLEQVNNALQNGYEGIFLFRPEDFSDSDLGLKPFKSNMVIFVRKNSR
ncbi:TPA: hypothetical protein DCL28_02560 [Candidatus Komeilibacteria bacterium]|nr:MAG: hypothetical protein UW91_C0005G0007 [Parcubacteria group bacterium GW2011_GWF2_45_11]KKT96500.1 MAG: hypothetical protein UW98_C0041G0005 [Parcubacteria group bacterium GW2011_GWC2_45_15]OGY92438.1 MAG: hypothetical protein A2260_04140 [Candidatus Komeilibacteria bacterium RIFOXYA2_FULL_45_9]OGY94759.1 MAG: hypothetical protein A3J95_01215 [Candidatus Komeilibacteria bacterium RIFOXYC2_FULL_45_12]HAH04416.1 hypothetical protein [Candidatus Komeilibacteria bacterium]